MEDRGFWKGTTRHQHHIPHFLLNDLTRFWRTMAVDFAYKLRDRQGKGAVMRNLKLRMSRKILFVAGLLGCFRCQLDFATEEERRGAYSAANRSAMLLRVESIFRLPPADLIASVLLPFPHLHDEAVALFNSYDVFLGLLADEETRKHLEEAPSSEGPVCDQAFDASRQFQEALLRIFFDNDSELGELTRRYGIF